MKKNERFEVIHKEGSIFQDVGYRMIMVDKETGVSYLLVSGGYGSSITPLLDAEGNPIIYRKRNEY